MKTGVIPSPLKPQKDQVERGEGASSSHGWDAVWQESFTRLVPSPSSYTVTEDFVFSQILQFSLPVSEDPNATKCGVRVVVLGAKESGKTSLIAALKPSKRYSIGSSSSLEHYHSGVQLKEHVESTNGPSVSLRFVEFPGSRLFMPLFHTFCLTDRSIYVLTWNVQAAELDLRLSITGREEKRLQYLLLEIFSFAPRSTVVLVGTRLDRLRDTSDAVYAEKCIEQMNLRLWMWCNSVFTRRLSPESSIATSPPRPRSLDREGSRGSSKRDSTVSEHVTPCFFSGSPITGNFCMSSESLTMVAGGAHRGLSPPKVNTLGLFFFRLAAENALDDRRLVHGQMPPLMRQLYDFILQIRRYFPQRLLMRFKTLYLVARYFTATKGGSTEISEEELKKVVLHTVHFLHDRGVVYMWGRHSLPVGESTGSLPSTPLLGGLAAGKVEGDGTAYILLQPEAMLKITSALVSYMQVLRTPRFRRSRYQDIPYAITEAEEADQLLYRKGYLRWPLARILLKQPITELLTSFTDIDVSMALSLVVALDVAYPVLVPCNDLDVLQAEPWGLPSEPTQMPASSSSSSIVKGRVVAASSLHRNTSGTKMVLRLFFPLLAPHRCPSSLREVAPLLFHRGMRFSFRFSALPDPVWHSIQCRLSPLTHLVAIHHKVAPTTIEAMEEELLYTKQPKEVHDEETRWKDAIWLRPPPQGPDKAEGSSRIDLRGLLYMHEREIVLYLSRVVGAQTMVEEVQKAIMGVLEGYRGIVVQCFTGCANKAACGCWVPAPWMLPAVSFASRTSSPMGSPFSDKKESSCVVCGTTIDGESVGPGGTARHPMVELIESSRPNIRVLSDCRATARELFASSLSPAACKDVSRVLGLDLYENEGMPCEEGTKKWEESCRRLDQVVAVALYQDCSSRTSSNTKTGT